MKNRLLILLSFLYVLTLQAQKELSKDYSYTVSEPYRVIDGAKYYYTYKNEILAVKLDKKIISIQKFGVEGLKELTRIEYKKGDIFPKNWVFEGMNQIKDRVFFYYSSWDGGKNKNERLFVKSIDFSTGEFIDKEDHKIISTEGKVSGMMVSGGFSLSVVDKFDIEMSKDSTKVLVKYRKKPKVKNDKESYDIIGLHVFDKELTKVWGNEYKMPYTERQMDLLDFEIDDDANIYALVKKFHDDSNKDKKNRKDKKANYHIELFKYAKETNELSIEKIALKDKYISELALFENANNKIICAGYYNNGSSVSDVEGLVMFDINKDGGVSKEKYYEIPVEILNQYESKKTERKNKKKDKKDEATFTSLKLRNLIFHDDLSISFVGEEYYVKTFTYMTKSGMRTRYSYHYNDMLMAKINSNSELSWMKKIPKRQMGSSGLGGMSFTYLNAKGFHYLIYLDNVKNIELPLNKVPALHKNGAGGYLTACKINDVTGDVSKGSILDTRRLTDKIAAHQFNTDRVIKTSDDKFVVEVYKKKKEDVLIKINIKE